MSHLNATNGAPSYWARRATLKYRDYLDTPEWQWLRKAARERAHGVCERCGVNPARDTSHRAGYFYRFRPETVDDVWALCHDCHRAYDGFPNVDDPADKVADPDAGVLIHVKQVERYDGPVPPEDAHRDISWVESEYLRAVRDDDHEWLAQHDEELRWLGILPGGKPMRVRCVRSFCMSPCCSKQIDPNCPHTDSVKLHAIITVPPLGLR